MKDISEKLLFIFQKLYDVFGPRSWWPGDTAFEVITGAILTQNTSWGNVEKAIGKMKKEKLLCPKKVYDVDESVLAEIIRPSGYYNIKARRLKNFVDFLFEAYQGDLLLMFAEDIVPLREKLLNVHGIGPETADSILLYAGHKPVFVVDAYTKRFLSRHNFIPENAGYQEIQDLFMENLSKNTALYNEYHALIVHLGKNFCKRKPFCCACPLSSPEFSL